MALHQIEDIASYVRYLQENAQEQDLLFNELLIGVTSFFRDREAFECLKKAVFPRILQGRLPNDTIRIWVAGCATGEEVYSLAILLMEYAETREERHEIQIFASDLDGWVSTGFH